MLTEPADSTPSSGTGGTDAPGSGSMSGQGLESPQGGQEEGAGGFFPQGVIHVTPQDKEAIERVWRVLFLDTSSLLLI